MADNKDIDIQDRKTSRSTSLVGEIPSSVDVEHQAVRNGGASDIAEKSTIKDPNIVDWDVEDPENPLNWSRWKKIGVVVVVAFITMLS